MTTVPERARHRYTFAEYLAVEADSGMKHEYDDGEIVAMVGGSRRYAAFAVVLHRNGSGWFLPFFMGARLWIRCSTAGLGVSTDSGVISAARSWV